MRIRDWEASLRASAASAAISRRAIAEVGWETPAGAGKCHFVQGDISRVYVIASERSERGNLPQSHRGGRLGDPRRRWKVSLRSEYRSSGLRRFAVNDINQCRKGVIPIRS